MYDARSSARGHTGMTQSAEEKLPISEFTRLLNMSTFSRARNGGKLWSSLNLTERNPLDCTSGRKETTYGRENTSSMSETLKNGTNSRAQ